jgi:hypothetical protein
MNVQRSSLSKVTQGDRILVTEGDGTGFEFGRPKDPTAVLRSVTKLTTTPDQWSGKTYRVQITGGRVNEGRYGTTHVYVEPKGASQPAEPPAAAPAPKGRGKGKGKAQPEAQAAMSFEDFDRKGARVTNVNQVNLADHLVTPDGLLIREVVSTGHRGMNGPADIRFTDGSSVSFDTHDMGATWRRAKVGQRDKNGYPIYTLDVEATGNPKVTPKAEPKPQVELDLANNGTRRVFTRPDGTMWVKDWKGGHIIDKTPKGAIVMVTADGELTVVKDAPKAEPAAAPVVKPVVIAEVEHDHDDDELAATGERCAQCKGYTVVRKRGSQAGKAYRTLNGSLAATANGNSATCPVCKGTGLTARAA